MCFQRDGCALVKRHTLRCAKLDVESICGKRACMKNAYFFTFSIVELDDRRWFIIFICSRPTVRSFLFGIIATNFSKVLHTAL